MNKKVLNKIIKVIAKILFICLLILLALSIYIRKNFSTANFEQLFVSFVKSEGTSFSSIKYGLIYTIVFSMLFIFAFILLPASIEILIKRKEYKLKIKNKTILKINTPFKRGKIYYILISALSIFIILNNLGVIEYISNRFNKTELYEKYYVNPKEVKFKFPENKKNLIYIYLESMESSFANAKNNVSYIPELESLAKENINFSNTSGVGGALSVRNTTWTVSGMVAQTAGIPMTTTVSANSYKDYSSFLSGAYTLGEVLKDNGYLNYLLLGSKAEFAGRDVYFKQHGNYTIFDYNYALETNKIVDGYKVWWGYEDKKLYNFAKEKLLEISKNNTNFNFTILTADTHFQDGYLDDHCEKKYKEQYANVLACSSKMLNEFIKWVKEQSFYDNTVIVIAGDHITMQYGDFINTLNENRTIYNVFINTDKDQTYTKNRLFSTMDLYPTTLSALNVEFDSDMLGLGTNLFSGKKTLLEEYNQDYINEELSKTSDYYNYNILKSSYYEMIKPNPSKK